ncbi:hypothetical protein Q0590_12640 [Rhodocytophaga aerolata]|uniref:DUF5034 domain-containing protein n=2 Tax=Rhodocytophaga aerolata TaxID=455078 RepID=A0ABT8R4V7_9BACT|nr:hypothetical protein [Rhodocytophaga aerolata]MDO1447108.1 hypothetical protein [Rhodocytophaga aerolata]
MKMGRIILLTLFFITNIVGCSCPDTPDYFDINGLELTVYKYDQQTDKYTAVENDLWLTMDKFYLKLNFNFHYYGSLRQFTNPYAAYALTCEDRGHRGTDEKIESLHIVTLTDFDTQHLQGDTLDNLFSVSHYGTGQKMPLSQLVADTSRIYYRDIILYMEQKPGQNPIQFQIDMQLNTGEKYSVTSRNMMIR